METKHRERSTNTEKPTQREILRDRDKHTERYLETETKHIERY
jgi:hypothetical protein